MIKQIYPGLIVCLATALTGCAVPPSFTPGQKELSQSAKRGAIPVEESHDSDIQDHSRFSPLRHNKSLNDYAQQMVMQLQNTGAITGPVAVTSFVEFDENLTRTNSLGNQLAEAVLIEMSQAGYPVADVNASGAISVNADGSFAFSRHQKKLVRNLCCVLSGNLIYEANGVRVNSKLFNLQSKKVLTATSVMIPYFVVEHLGEAGTR